jgi:tetratricopeptide (TPR) repeat protein
VAFFETYLNDYPYSETAWYHLGVAQFRQGQHDAAKRSLGFAVTIDETFSAALFDLGRLHEDLEEFREGLDCYQQSMASSERNGYTLYRIGVCLQSLDRNAEAQRAFQEAVELDEELDEAWIELAVLHGEAGNVLKGVQHAQKAIALDPDNPDYHMVAHDLFLQLGLQREAAKSLQLILHALRVETPRGLLEYAGILVEMSHLDSAVTLLEAGVQRHADDPLMWAVYFGFLWKMAGDLPAAHTGIQQSWLRFGAPFQEALVELYPDVNADPVVALIWSQPNA